MQNTLTDGKWSGASDAQLCGWQFDMQGAFERVPEFPQLLPSGNTQASDHENHGGLDFDRIFPEFVCRHQNSMTAYISHNNDLMFGVFT